MALASGTIALYDFEGDLSNNVAGGSAATAVGSITYPTTNPWHGTKVVQATTPSLTANNGFSVPASCLAAVGTAEFTIEVGADKTSNQHVFYLKGAANERVICVYIFGGSLQLFINGNAGVAVTAAININTKYYVKVTWDGSAVKLYTGAWTTAGTVTLALAGTLGAPTWGGGGAPTIAYGMHYSPSAVAGFLGTMDWLRVRNVYDATTTVTTDPSAGSVLSPTFMRRRRR